MKTKTTDLCTILAILSDWIKEKREKNIDMYFSILVIAALNLSGKTQTWSSQQTARIPGQAREQPTGAQVAADTPAS